MSAVEMMMNTLLKATGLNMEEVKAEFVKRIGQFEQNIKLLNDTLIEIKKDQKAIADHLQITLPSTANKDTANGPGNSISALPRPVETSSRPGDADTSNRAFRA